METTVQCQCQWAAPGTGNWNNPWGIQSIGTGIVGINHEVLLGTAGNASGSALSLFSPTSTHGAPRIPLWGWFPPWRTSQENFENLKVPLWPCGWKKCKPTYFKPTPVAGRWNISLFKESVGTCRHPRAQSLVWIINPAKIEMKLSCPSLKKRSRHLMKCKIHPHWRENVALSRENSVQKMWLFNESSLCLVHVLGHENRFGLLHCCFGTFTAWRAALLDFYFFFSLTTRTPLAASPAPEWITPLLFNGMVH